MFKPPKIRVVGIAGHHNFISVVAQALSELDKIARDELPLSELHITTAWMVMMYPRVVECLTPQEREAWGRAVQRALEADSA